MKSFLTGTLLAICLSATVAWSQDDQARYQTVTLTTSSVTTNGLVSWTGTNSVDIAEGEVGEIVNYAGGRGNAGTYVIKNAKVFGTPGKVAGPATFRMFTEYNTSSYTADNVPADALMTVKITPLTYSPHKSLTVAPGMGNVQIELESSTNLLTWAASTNGVYNDDLRFFRVKLTKLNP